MKLKLKLNLLSALLTFGLAFGAGASVLLQDNFDSYSVGALPTNNLALGPWLSVSGAGDIQVVTDPTGPGGTLQVSQALALDIKALLATNTTLADVIATNVTTVTNIVGTTTNVVSTTNFSYGFSPSNSVNALYESMNIYVTTVPTVTGSSQTYFTHFTSDTSGFRARLFIVTNGAAAGMFRVALQNGGSAVTNTIPIDLSINTSYKIVSRYILGTSVSTVWLNPTSETSDTSTTGIDTQTPTVINAYAYRQNGGEGIIDADNLLVGTTFADVVPGSLNPPTFTTQPVDANLFASGTAVFKSLALGDADISYKWYYNTNTPVNDNGTTISGALTSVLTLTNLNTIQSGTYSCVASNAAGTNLTRFAVLTVSPTPIPPTITNEPVSVANIVGDTVTLNVGATGLPAPAFQWKYITNNGTIFITNNASGANVTGTNTDTLTFTSILPGQAGMYFCTITNIAGYQKTNSSVATITLSPAPVITIADFRSRVDDSFAPTNLISCFTLQGTVTTWTNMTTSKTSLEFYMQDDTGGIAVFWLAADPTNLPPAGAVVRVTGPMAVFGGLIEIEPVFTNAAHSLTVISTGNALPTPQPLPFDPNITGDTATMKKLESMYFVASNVTLTAGAPYPSGKSELMTNNMLHVKTFSDTTLTVQFTNDVGQTFKLFINGATEIPGLNQPAGAVTIFGILGFFTGDGFEFTPSRLADIISYTRVTNVVSNVKHYGDLLTNTYSENVLRPNETMTTAALISDPEGGLVTLTPDMSTLPPSATWDGITGGAVGTATFHFNPTSGDAGSNYVVNLGVSATSGSLFTNTFTVYVPSATEQKMAITEFLVNPTTNSNAANFNPLHRSTDTIGITTNDVYVEVANQSSSAVDFTGWLIAQGTKTLEDFNAVSPGPPTLSPTSAMVIYAGNAAEAPSIAVSGFRSTSGGLPLLASGTSSIILRNQNGNIVDRVTYSGSDLSTNGSLSRFPTIDSPFVLQEFISTNTTTAGLQYDGGSWGVPTQIPTGVTNIVSSAGSPVSFNFTADTTKMSTLWMTPSLPGRFKPVAGKEFTTTSGSFAISNLLSPTSFFFITSQSNYVTSP